jgi:rhamnose utilization protein RhaD (predicted bifunctional aldolase and dehydrogenase)/NAD(P)-dependent dehydrogenase (short-subunit alcohol dehydrogenase family)
MKSKWSTPPSIDDLLIRTFTSRLLGGESDLVLHGGGNTSVKRDEIDHTGKKIRVLRVKGSGSDLATITESGFTGLRMDDLEAAKGVESMDDITMADYLRKSMINPQEPSPSVESFLHAFIPFRFVDHSHSDAILSVTNTDLGDDQVRKILGDVIVLPYIPPGFKLAKAVLSVIDKAKDVSGLVLRKHGLFTFADNARKSYENHLLIVTRAEEFRASRKKADLFPIDYEKVEIDEMTLIPKLRGLLSSRAKKIVLSDRSDLSLQIARSKKTEAMCLYGPATPDMLIRTKYDFLYIGDIAQAEKLVLEYRERYAKEHSKYASSYTMHDPNPNVIVIRGYGMLASGSSYRECMIIRDQALHSFSVNAYTDFVSKHAFITKEEAYEMEYWPLEEAKLKKYKPRKLEGTVAVVTGAAGGIGLEAFRTLALAGSHVVALDLDAKVNHEGESIFSESSTANLPIVADMSDEAAVTNLYLEAVRKFGGIDIVFNNAGILKTAPIDKISMNEMDQMYKVNARGTFLITREAFRIMKTQGTGGNFVFNITKNLTNPGEEMTMYGTTKAFAAHLSHYVAKEGGRYKIRSNIINPDKIFRGSRIWENGVLESRAKAKGQTVDEYKTQNLLRIEVLPSHVAGVLLALLDEDSFGATTDAMIPVDGGIK